MKKLLLILCLVGLSGCGVLALSQVKVVQSSLPRLTVSGAEQADISAFSAGEQDFTFNLYRQLNSRPGNLLFSPHSLYTNLMMNYAGARGNTQSQMAQVLQIALPFERLHAAANALEQDLSAAGNREGTFQLSVANSLWAQQEYAFLPSYLDLLAQNYGSGIHQVDYKQAASRQQTLLAINQWASDQTHGKINQLVVPEALDEKTRLVLISTVYFNAEWLERFEPNRSSSIFTLRNGDTVTVPFITSQRFDNKGHSMDIGRYPAYTYNNEVNVVEVPYKGGRVSFVALMPMPGSSLEALEASLTADKLKSLLTFPAGHYNLFIEMPKFSFESPLELSGSLAAMGMVDAFDPLTADFSGMSEEHTLLISNVAQKTMIRVNELELKPLLPVIRV
jgi:serpin B